MDLSVFPRGKYFVKQAIVRFKNPFGHPESRPFALIIEPLTNTGGGSSKRDMAKIWDINAFRPDPRDFFEMFDASSGVKAMVLYESVNYTGGGGCHKIPRYIIADGDTSDVDGGKRWLVNVR